MKKIILLVMALVCLTCDAQTKSKNVVRKDTVSAVMTAVPGTTGYTVTYVGGDPTKNAENMKTAVKIIGKGVSNTLNVLGGCSSNRSTITGGTQTNPNPTYKSAKSKKPHKHHK